MSAPLATDAQTSPGAGLRLQRYKKIYRYARRSVKKNINLQKNAQKGSTQTDKFSRKRKQLTSTRRSKKL